MTVSVIVPVYNAEDFIEEAVDSILNQSLLPDEIILIDDGSTDHSLQIIQSIDSTNSITKVFTQENLGPAISRNRGVEYASSEWVCFLDADDLLHPKRIEIAANYTNIETDAIICEFVRFNEKDKIYFPDINPDKIHTLPATESIRSVIKNGYGLPRMLMRKSTYLNSGGIDEDLINNEDHELHFRMLTQGVRFRKIIAGLYYYRQHKSSNRVSNQENKITLSVVAIRKMIDQIPNLPSEFRYLAKVELGNRLANRALKLALIGDEYKVHIKDAQSLNPNLKPYSKKWMNKISSVFGYGWLESLYSKINS